MRLAVRRSPVPFVLCSLAAALAFAACARPPSPAPEGDWLAHWLRSSDTAATVVASAQAHNWLSRSEDGVGEVGDLRAVMRAVGAEDRDDLEAALHGRDEELRDLMTGLRLRRIGGTRGDRSHWVAVGLLVFAEDEPDRSLIPQSARWEEGYVDDILELRAYAAAGSLSVAARPLGFDGDPPPENLLFRSPSGIANLAARQYQENWPVFEAPASQAIRGVAAFEAGDPIWKQDFRWQVQRPARARVVERYVRVVPVYRLEPDGTLTIDGGENFAVDEGREVVVLAQEPVQERLWVWLGDGRIARVRDECCEAPRDGNTLLWVQLQLGDHAGLWTTLPDDRFAPVPRDAMTTRSSAPRRPSLPSLGRLGRGRSLTDTLAGAEHVIWRDGAHEADPVFVLHGGPGFGSHYLREPLVELLGDRLQLIFYDQRGSGFSGGLDDPDALTMARLVADLELLRRRSELERLDLMGHSFGGLLALHYAIAHPERVRSLVLVDSDPATHADWSRFEERVQARITPEDARMMERLQGQADFRNQAHLRTAWVGLRMRGYTARPEAADGIDFGLVEAVLDNLSTTPGLIRADLGEWDLTADLASISARTLVVAGGDSVFPVSAAQALRDGIPNAELVVLPDVGHFPWVEAPQAFREAVLAFHADR